MERRKFLLGAGSAAVGASAVIGSGAFTSVEADRTVTVETADDSDAYLKMAVDGNANGGYADESGGTISVTLDELNRDALTTAYDIFTIENRGTQDALVYAQPSGLQDQGAFDKSVDNIYFDPQFSGMPNTDDDTLGTLPDGTPYGSLTGNGGSVENFEEQVFKSNSEVTHDAETFILPVGKSFDFGVYVKTNGEPGSVDYNVTIEADAALARKAQSE
jgi:hypothetical protein